MTDKRKNIEHYFSKIMLELGLDLNEPSLKKTPYRVAKMFVDELFYGLDKELKPRMMTVPNVYGCDEMIVIRDIKVNSCCEHHFVPFIGVAHIGYIPNDKILGLSKFNRLVDFYCRKPQIQEKLTTEIHTDLLDILDTDSIAIVVEAEHLCVKIRGIKDQNSRTITSKLSGSFRENIDTRAEFMKLIKE